MFLETETWRTTKVCVVKLSRAQILVCRRAGLPHVAGTDSLFFHFFLLPCVGLCGFFCFNKFLGFTVLCKVVYLTNRNVSISLLIVIYNCKYIFSRQNILLLHFVRGTSPTLDRECVDVARIKWWGPSRHQTEEKHLCSEWLQWHIVYSVRKHTKAKLLLWPAVLCCFLCTSISISLSSHVWFTL